MTAADRAAVSRDYRRAFGRAPDLRRPGTFNEKILWRKLHDRRPILEELQDKRRAREYVRARVGDDPLVELLQVTDDPDAIDFASLPDRFVVKPTHGAGWISIVPDKAAADEAAIRARARDWLAQAFGVAERSWAYARIPRRLLVERYLEGEDGGPAPDAKFYCFDGEPAVYHVCFDRFGLYRQTFYDMAQRPLPVLNTGLPDPEGAPTLHGFERYVDLARRLSAGLDFVRVDLLSWRGRPMFGEFTLYPNSGCAPFSPYEFDVWLGAQWRLPRLKSSPAARARSPGTPSPAS